MYKILIWGCGGTFMTFCSYIYKAVDGGEVSIVGFTGSNTVIKTVDKYPFFNKEELRNIDYDFVIAAVSSASFDHIVEEGRLLGIPREKFIKATVFSLPGFDFNKYIRIRQNPPSIISQNCFGGLLYNRMDLPFCSPTINLFFKCDDFIKFCTNFSEYINIEPVLDHYSHDEHTKIDYPVAKINDIEIHFNHDNIFEEAIKKWDTRRTRLNFNNFLIVMRAEGSDMLNGYRNIPYRKICFTSFKSEEPDTYYLPLESGQELWSEVCSLGRGVNPGIDPLKLLYGDSNFMRYIYM